MHIPEAVKTYGLILLIIVASFWVASCFIAPPPPKNIIFAAGSVNGEYYRYAQIYKRALAEEGIIVKVLETAGSSENAELLMQGKANIAFIQSGSKIEDIESHVETLASLYYEPLWVFTRNVDQKQKDLQNLRNSRIAIGPIGSGTRAISLQLLDLNNITNSAILSEASGEQAVEALKNEKVDAAFFVSHPNAPYIQELLHDKEIHLLSFQRADAYTRLFPFLSKVQLNEGVVDIAANIPNSDIYLISSVAQLASRKDFNGVLKTLLVRTAMKIHADADIFSEKGQFPTLDYADLPIADEAERYFKYGPNFLQQILPFWFADMINRMVVMLIPLVGVMFPLLKIASPTYRWRTRSRIYRWYKKLKKMEEATSSEDFDLKKVLSSLESMDADVKKTQVPLSYADELYSLRQHIQLIKDQIQKIQ